MTSPPEETLEEPHPEPQPTAAGPRLLGILRRIGQELLRRPHWVLPAVASIIVFSVTAKTWNGKITQAGDGLPHLAAEAQIAGIMREGGDPQGPLGLLWGVPLLRFYQPGFYVTAAAIHNVTGMHPVAAHNILLVFCFALTPFSLAWGMRRLGLDPWAAGLASLVSLTSVAGFGTSFEAFYRPGVITQAMGGFFFPLFLGSFSMLLQGKAGALRTAAIFALAVLSHAPLAVFAAFAGGILFCSDIWPLRLIWKRLVVFSVLGLALTVFWILPFVHSSNRYRPIPDSVLRHNRVWWFAGVTAHELPQLLFTGRLLDDAKTPTKAKQRHELDKYIDKLNMSGTRRPRFPILSLILLGGFAMSLFRLRIRAWRFLSAGFAFSLLMYLGPDDIWWLNHLPFASRIQGFRTVYLMELCGFGLGGLALSELGGHGWRYLRDRLRGRWRLGGLGAFSVGVAVLLYTIAWHGHKVGVTAVHHLNEKPYEKMIEAARPTLDRFPLRVMEAYPTSALRRWSYKAHRGIQSLCGHFFGLGPQSAYFTCHNMAPPETRWAMGRRLGVAYRITTGKRVKPIRDAKDRTGKRVFKLHGKKHGHVLFEDEAAHFVQPFIRTALVIGEPRQWMYITRAWLQGFRRRGFEPMLPVLGDEELLQNADLVSTFDIVVVIEPDLVSESTLKEALRTYTKGGGLVYSTADLGDDIPRKELAIKGPEMKKVLDPKHWRSFDVVEERKGHQWIRGPHDATVTMPKAGWVMLPEQHAAGWRAELDGEPAKVYPVGPDFVGIAVPEGKHALRFFWERSSLEQATLVISLTSWAGVLLGLVFAAWRRRREPRVEVAA